jgi:hypothetical protein
MPTFTTNGEARGGTTAADTAWALTRLLGGEGAVILGVFSTEVRAQESLQRLGGRPPGVVYAIAPWPMDKLVQSWKH